MSAYYDLYETPSPNGSEEKKSLHARICPKETYTQKEFVEHVAMFQHLPKNIIGAALDACIDELGDLLFAAVKVARFAGIDPEQAAHAACEKFIRRFAAMETAAANDGTALEQCTLEQMLTLWQQAKQTVGAEQESWKSARQ